MLEGIIAISKTGGIGLKNGLPWKCSDDLKHFKRLTMGRHLIVGNTTFKSLPKLKGRTLHVVSADNPLEKILALKHDFIVIGGKSIYDQLLDKCSVIYCSLINDMSPADTYYELSTAQKKKTVYFEFEVNE